MPPAPKRKRGRPAKVRSLEGRPPKDVVGKQKSDDAEFPMAELAPKFELERPWITDAEKLRELEQAYPYSYQLHAYYMCESAKPAVKWEQASRYSLVRNISTTS